MVAKTLEVKDGKDIIKLLEGKEEFKKLPQLIKDLIKRDLERLPLGIPVPLITFKENNWFIAVAPIFDLAAQGKSEKEALDDLKFMIDDYMSDPDIKKPKMEQMIDMHVAFTNVIPTFNMLEGAYDPGQNTPVAK